MEDDDAFTAERKRLFAGVILERVGQGDFPARSAEGSVRSRRDDRGGSGQRFQRLGAGSDSWRAVRGGESCVTCPRREKAFAVCAPMEPMARSEARTELLRRYWTHYGPATVRDAAAFFAARQRDIRETLETLPVRRAESRGETFYWLENGFDGAREAPRCVFLAGFDPLLMGYCKVAQPDACAGESPRHLQPCGNRLARAAAGRPRRGALEARREKGESDVFRSAGTHPRAARLKRPPPRSASRK